VARLLDETNERSEADLSGAGEERQLGSSADDRPNVLWLIDITEHPTRQGKVYCCVVLFDGLFDYVKARRAVIETDEGLRERELRKVSILSDVIKTTFINRGFDDLTSSLAAHTAVNIFSVALDRWLDQKRPRRTLSEYLDETIDAFGQLARRPASC
jgi:hypothetical protein